MDLCKLKAAIFVDLMFHKFLLETSLVGIIMLECGRTPPPPLTTWSQAILSIEWQNGLSEQMNGEV